jgi:3-dehydroquinate synthase
MVNDDLGYPVVVSDDTRSEIAAFVRKQGRSTVVLCDANHAVAAVARGVADAASAEAPLAFPLGERRKRLNTTERVLEALLATGVERDALVIGVGGGVASDLFGFACATYMRGVTYAHVATTLVAMVDAAIGGKTGVNLGAGKNLAGSFADPAAVFCDVSALRTLPASAVREGLAEVVKAAIIEGGDLFEWLEELSPHPFARWPWSAIVAEAVKVKTMSVADDRLESGARQVLNLGHTFGHAIERASSYKITHGQAVALGIRAAGLLALRTGRFSEAEHLRVLTLLALFGLPLHAPLDCDEVLSAMRHDKKKRAGRQRFVLPRAIGDVEYGVECAPASVRAVLRRLAEPPGTGNARG